MVILQHACHITIYHAIRKLIGKRLGTWETGKHQMLVKETAFTSDHYLSPTQRGESEEHQEKNIPLPGAPREYPVYVALDHG